MNTVLLAAALVLQCSSITHPSRAGVDSVWSWSTGTYTCTNGKQLCMISFRNDDVEMECIDLREKETLNETTQEDV